MMTSGYKKVRLRSSSQSSASELGTRPQGLCQAMALQPQSSRKYSAAWRCCSRFTSRAAPRQRPKVSNAPAMSRQRGLRRGVVPAAGVGVLCGAETEAGAEAEAAPSALAAGVVRGLEADFMGVRWQPVAAWRWAARACGPEEAAESGHRILIKS